MKELLRVFPGNKDDKWTRYCDDQKQNADKFVDETIESIVANATHIRKLQELNKKSEQKTTALESHRHAIFPNNNCLKDAKKSFQLQNFNLAPSFIIRKRKRYDGEGPTNLDGHLPDLERCEFIQGQDSQNHFDPIDDAPVMIPTKKCAEDNNVKHPIASPIPDFIAKDFPLNFTDQLTSMMVAKPKTTRTELANITSASHYHPKRDNHEGYLLNADVEEPVKNSVFWLYRSFPHIA